MHCISSEGAWSSWLAIASLLGPTFTFKQPLKLWYRGDNVPCQELNAMLSTTCTLRACSQRMAREGSHPRCPVDCNTLTCLYFVLFSAPHIAYLTADFHLTCHLQNRAAFKTWFEHTQPHRMYVDTQSVNNARDSLHTASGATLDAVCRLLYSAANCASLCCAGATGGSY